MLNAISIDVEEYFHATETQRFLGADRWSALPPRVEFATGRVLEMLSQHQVVGTFFILGWVAERYPRLVSEIANAGHEIGCHGYAHKLVYQMSFSEFREDTERAKRAIEDACGISPRAYRAASYSITKASLWALEILAEAGFSHDSSIYPILHDRYGIPGFSRRATIVVTGSGPILEVPVATVRLSPRRSAPVGGGAYLRLLPYRYTAAGIRRINLEERMPACIYVHPWEFDVEQPRLASGLLSRVRMYGGLGAMQSKLCRLLSDFRFSKLTTVYPAGN
jgi:polysaccharide deacetylase family protein (PEP-CTERM system associated)